MAIGPLGSVIFTNQMTPAAASNQNANQNRIDFQNMIAESQLQEKDKKILEVRPAEENQRVNKDKEQSRDEADRESERDENTEVYERSKKLKEDKSTENPPLYKLDVTV